MKGSVSVVKTATQKLRNVAIFMALNVVGTLLSICSAPAIFKLKMRL
jgi:hypothetical protein